ncbi:hypothetical protein BCV72DRAFT_235148, partial [Rhizopus microsporus var. microsporus]
MDITIDTTEGQRICMLFYVTFTEENVIKYKKKIEDFHKIGICWKQPILVSKTRILGDPMTYTKYIKSKSANVLAVEEVKVVNKLDSTYPLNLLH